MLLYTIVCPFCLGGNRECCRCDSCGRVPFEGSWNLLKWMWDREGCECETCEGLREKRFRAWREK